GAVPSYYLRYFYAHDAVLREQLDGTPRAEVVGRIEHELLDLYRDPTVVERPALLMQRGGAYYSEAALGLADDDVSRCLRVWDATERSRSPSAHLHRSCSASSSTSRRTSG
ncbi:MAG TPA: hypothetical protein VMH47_06295, partial [Gaiellaceae bacterium]|nr:hypothetical protein [Gaiellaceae bacterium]